MKCTKQFAPSAVKNAKFPSNPTAQDQYTAESALQEKARKIRFWQKKILDTVYASYQQTEDSFYFFSFSLFYILNAQLIQKAKLTTGIT